MDIAHREHEETMGEAIVEFLQQLIWITVHSIQEESLVITQEMVVKQEMVNWIVLAQFKKTMVTQAIDLVRLEQTTLLRKILQNRQQLTAFS
jgi:hypothetical protein